MNNHKVRLCRRLEITLILAFQFVASAQTRGETHREINDDIRCTIQVQDGEWNPAAPATVTGKIENLTQNPLVVYVMPMFALSPRTSDAKQEGYWAPVDLLQDRPLAVDKRPVDPKGKAVSIDVHPIKLAFKKGGSIDFHVDGRHVLWGRQSSSAFPSQELFATVKPGSYDLNLDLEWRNGPTECGSVMVVVGASKPVRPKP